ncbi:MAG: hypothetical protein ABWZ53_11640 [Actinomycetota bacterium]
MNASDDPRGPWPDPDEPGAPRPGPGETVAERADDDRLRAEAEDIGSDAAAIAADLDAASDRIVDHLDDVDDRWAAWDDRTEAKGSKGIAIAVAAVNLGGLLALPAMLVVGIYTFVTVYAIVKAVGAGSDEANAVVVLLGVVGLVTLLVTMLGVGGWLVGRSADPKKRGR